MRSVVIVSHFKYRQAPHDIAKAAANEQDEVMTVEHEIVSMICATVSGAQNGFGACAC